MCKSMPSSRYWLLRVSAGFQKATVNQRQSDSRLTSRRPAKHGAMLNRISSACGWATDKINCESGWDLSTINCEYACGWELSDTPWIWRNAKLDSCACGWELSDTQWVWRNAKHDELSSPRRPNADVMAKKPVDIHKTVLYDKDREVNMTMCFLRIITTVLPRHEFIAHRL